MYNLFYVVEDDLSRAVALKLIQSYVQRDLVLKEMNAGQGGAGSIRKNLGKYAGITAPNGVLIVTDLDQGQCPPSLRNEWMESNRLARIPHNLIFCVAVREIESWLIADVENLASFLRVRPEQIERNPESNLDNPKGHLVSLARRSGNSDLKRDLTPQRGSRAAVGLGYNARLVEFVNQRWNPEAAAQNSPSLQRAINRLRTF